MYRINYPNGLEHQGFLRNFWQRRPLLLPNALPGYRCPLQPEELAGLACEPEVESRLVLEQGASGPWELRQGPFSEADFAALPRSHWTLLVQDVEKHYPPLRDLVDVAIADYDQAIELDPGYAPAYRGRGGLYSEQGDTEQAIVDFDSAIALNPNDPDTFYNRGNVHLDTGDTEQAEAETIVARGDRSVVLGEPPAREALAHRLAVGESVDVGERAFADAALDRHFDRIQNMMFVRTRHRPTGGGPAEVEDDGCE